MLRGKITNDFYIDWRIVGFFLDVGAREAVDVPQAQRTNIFVPYHQAQAQPAAQVIQRQVAVAVPAGTQAGATISFPHPVTGGTMHAQVPPGFEEGGTLTVQI